MPIPLVDLPRLTRSLTASALGRALAPHFISFSHRPGLCCRRFFPWRRSYPTLAVARGATIARSSLVARPITASPFLTYSAAPDAAVTAGVRRSIRARQTTRGSIRECRRGLRQAGERRARAVGQRRKRVGGSRAGVWREGAALGRRRGLRGKRWRTWGRRAVGRRRGGRGWGDDFGRGAGLGGPRGGGHGGGRGGGRFGRGMGAMGGAHMGGARQHVGPAFQVVPCSLPHVVSVAVLGACGHHDAALKAAKLPTLQKPTALWGFSRLADGSVWSDERCLRRLRPAILGKEGPGGWGAVDLNEGFEGFVRSGMVERRTREAAERGRRATRV
ncbi:unnamed protein product, partial [Closterium sp. NIES-64]